LAQRRKRDEARGARWEGGEAQGSKGLKKFGVSSSKLKGERGSWEKRLAFRVRCSAKKERKRANNLSVKAERSILLDREGQVIRPKFPHPKALKGNRPKE